MPYGEADAEWFFGRREWTEIIVDNLRAYRISILYGASGVGKSSVLNAGVIRGLRTLAASNLAATGTPQLVVVPFAAWSSDEPVAALQEAIREAVEMTAPALAHRPPTGRLADVCVEWGNRISGPLLVVLDQFEEYFLYHRGDRGPGSLDEELSVALRRRSTPANFVLSIREDALAQLDRFEGRVPACSKTSSGSTTSTARPRARRSNGRSSTGTAFWRARRGGGDRAGARRGRARPGRDREAAR